MEEKAILLFPVMMCLVQSDKETLLALVLLNLHMRHFRDVVNSPYGCLRVTTKYVFVVSIIHSGCHGKFESQSWAATKILRFDRYLLG